MVEEIKMPIPARLKNAAVGGHVAGAEDIIDDNLDKEQNQINQDRINDVNDIKGGSTKSIANLDNEINGNGGIDERLGTVEELATISIGGGDAQIATGSDFDNPTAEQRAKVTTVGAILDGMDDEPTVGSDNLVKSGGVYDELYEAKYTPQSFTGTPIENSYIGNSGALGTSSGYHINYYPCQKGDVFKLSYSEWSGTSARSYGVYSTNDPSEFGTSTNLAVGPVGNTTEVFNIEITDDTAQLLAVTVYSTDSNMTLTKQSFVNKINALEIGDVNAMIASKDWRVSGNVTYDSNEIPVSYNITWADGESGTVVMSNFNSDVFEYTTITVTYKTKTIVYTLTYDSNGYVTNETYVEQ